MQLLSAIYAVSLLNYENIKYITCESFFNSVNNVFYNINVFSHTSMLNKHSFLED